MRWSTWNTFRDLNDLHREINRLFEDLPDASKERPYSRFSFLPGIAARSYPLLNLREDGTQYRIEALAPGIDPQTLKVSVSQNEVTIEGEKQVGAPAGIKAEAFHRNERAAGRFVRTITLPAPPDPSGVVAEYRDGLLQITLPKSAEARPRQIAVKVG